MDNLDVLAALASRAVNGPKPKARNVDEPETWADIYFDNDPDTGVWYVGPTPKPAMGAPEDDEQARLFTWLRSPEGGRQHGLVAHSVPNDGAGSRERMVALKRTGLTPGACDLYCFGPRGNLAIEMKRSNGVRSDVSDTQLGHLASLAPFPLWNSCVCFGYRAARAAIARFLLSDAHGLTN